MDTNDSENETYSHDKETEPTSEDDANSYENDGYENLPTVEGGGSPPLEPEIKDVSPGDNMYFPENQERPPSKVRIEGLKHIHPDAMSSMASAFTLRQSQETREQKALSQLILWSFVLAICIIAVAYNLNAGDEGGGNLNSKRRIWDYVLFFAMLFVAGRFLTASAAVIVISSVAAFHIFERIHYRDLPPPGVTGQHVRYFMLMYILCFVSLRTISGAREFMSVKSSTVQNGSKGVASSLGHSNSSENN